MAERHKVPAQCRGCRHLWTGGVKDGKHDRWCCRFSAPAPKIAGHCRLHNGFEPPKSEEKQDG